MRLSTRLLPAFALALAACTGGGSDGAATMMTADTPDMAGPPPPDMAHAPYPPGPYGVNVGDTLFDFTGKGYPLSRDNTDSTSFMGMLSSIKVDTLYFNPACKCILLSIAAEWCGPCNQEQPAVIDAVNKDPSLCAYEVLLQGKNPQGPLASQPDLDDWTQYYQHNFPVVLPTLAAKIHLPEPDSLPTNAVVDPSTMKIVDIIKGFSPAEDLSAKALCKLQ